ncbi:MAG TPA: PEP/pyruvate-binding domain-containing protein [Acidimicrobiales bacterium]|nr:PEP/pyruvate-binding domain-containing protein [Acidimicrobiales bacterium]
MSTAVFEPGPNVEAAGAVVTLDSAAALDPATAGAKAAALARSLRAGLPVLPGWVVTTSAFAGSLPVGAELRGAWAAATDHGRRPVVVRSSSTVEDSSTSSMAGMFTSVLDVLEWSAFREAVDTVLHSAKLVTAEPAPIAVLVQPQLAPTVGGVMFGVDPVTGRTDHVVVSASEAGPAAVVGGTVDGSRYVLSRRRMVDGPEGGPLSSDSLRQLRALAHRAERVFGGPQDIEWAFGADGHLWLLQSRPVTAIGSRVGKGPTLGPGPVAETFPEPLSPLEEDLWVEPLRDGLRAALALAGTTKRRRLAESPVVTTVAGRVAADLDLLLGNEGPTSLWQQLDPRPPMRRLVAAWRVGRLRSALPALAADLVAKVDGDLLAVGAVQSLSDRELLGVLGRSRQGLTALHGYEVLLGWLVTPDAVPTGTAASVALRAVAAGRAEGLSDEELVLRHPSVLALVAPRIGATIVLPPAVDALIPGRADDEEPDRAAVLREALRLRARWLQELTARAAWELGGRLVARGAAASACDVRWLRMPELVEAVATGTIPADVPARAGDRAGAPLPARFRLTAAGTVAPAGRRPHSGRVRRHGRGGTGRAGAGTGAGGGRGSGPVHGGDGAPEAGAVLVVRTLDPDLAPLLPRLGGLVAETGSFLSHLAILAREFGVPTAVGVEDAVARFPAGSTVVVDGTTGEVTLVEGPERGAA